MHAEPVQPSNASISSRSGASEDAIEACCDLLSAGRPISEILIALKRFAPLNEATEAERCSDKQDGAIDPQARGTSPHGETALVAGKPFTGQFDFAPHISRTKLPLAIHRSEMFQTFRTVQPAKPRRDPIDLADCFQDSLGASIGGAVAEQPYSLVACKVQHWPVSARLEKASGVKLSRSIGVVLFWLIPVISLTLAGAAGKLLTDADSPRKNSVTETPAQGDFNAVASSTATAITPGQFVPERAAVAIVTAASAEQAANAGTTMQARIQSADPLTVRGGRRTLRASRTLTGQLRSAPRYNTEFQGISLRPWTLPPRLTDGF